MSEQIRTNTLELVIEALLAASVDLEKNSDSANKVHCALEFLARDIRGVSNQLGISGGIPGGTV